MTTTAEDSARRLAEEHGLRFVDLSQLALAPGVASLVPESVARHHHAVPVGRRLGTPVIAVSDPGDRSAMEALRESLGREFVAVVARPEQVERAIVQIYSPSGAAETSQAAAAGPRGGPRGGMSASVAGTPLVPGHQAHAPAVVPPQGSPVSPVAQAVGANGHQNGSANGVRQHDQGITAEAGPREKIPSIQFGALSAILTGLPPHAARSPARLRYTCGFPAMGS